MRGFSPYLHKIPGTRLLTLALHSFLSNPRLQPGVHRTHLKQGFSPDPKNHSISTPTILPSHPFLRSPDFSLGSMIRILRSRALAHSPTSNLLDVIKKLFPEFTPHFTILTKSIPYLQWFRFY